MAVVCSDVEEDDPFPQLGDPAVEVARDGFVREPSPEPEPRLEAILPFAAEPLVESLGEFPQRRGRRIPRTVERAGSIARGQSDMRAGVGTVGRSRANRLDPDGLMMNVAQCGSLVLSGELLRVCVAAGLGGDTLKTDLCRTTSDTWMAAVRQSAESSYTEAQSR